ncbi:serpin-ZX-like [Silene latifolia]|uniref:serpin-ZX-like n=1 Tax=Silene latifolia TaxID=37657 RepID=UPI003D76D6D6
MLFTLLSSTGKLEREIWVKLCPDTFSIHLYLNNKIAYAFIFSQSKISINLKVALAEANKRVSSYENFVCSPLGIHILLSILANGSTGETRNQIYKVLGSKTLKEINKTASDFKKVVYPKIDANLKGLETPEVSFVNGAWVDQQNTSLRPAFQKLLEGTYKADVQAVDFQNKEEVCEDINSWVREATSGLITELLSPQLLEQDTILVLGNALFFKAAWKIRFVSCVNKAFYLITGETIIAPFMSTLKPHYQFRGALFDDFKLVRFPYKTGQDTTRQFAMYIFLPNANDGLLSLMERFSKDPGFLDQLELSSVFSQIFGSPNSNSPICFRSRTH